MGCHRKSSMVSYKLLLNVVILSKVVSKIHTLSEKFDVEQYGALSYAPEKYPLFAIKTHNWDPTKPTVLITGGIHGYETSGVHGALAFLTLKAEQYSADFNILVVPCVSPWGYETINRWNPNAVDPNRSFYANSPAEESAALMKLVQAQQTHFLAHLDLHETTDSDESEFRPALAARDGKEYIEDTVPDGFYQVLATVKTLSMISKKPLLIRFAMLPILHQQIAMAILSGEPITQEGVINYSLKALGLCASVTDAEYTSTTEVYPDSPRVTDNECNMAQVAAIVGALEYLKQHK